MLLTQIVPHNSFGMVKVQNDALDTTDKLLLGHTCPWSDSDHLVILFRPSSSAFPIVIIFSFFGIIFNTFCICGNLWVFVCGGGWGQENVFFFKGLEDIQSCLSGVPSMSSCILQS